MELVSSIRNEQGLLDLGVLTMQYKKSSGVLLFNDNGELLLQLRAAQDSSYPSHWDFSAGGGIDPEEDNTLSAERELRE